MKRFSAAIDQAGSSLVEIVLACATFPIIVSGLAGVYNTVNKSYNLSRQFNEMYTVLSACPEIDRALEYDSISNTTNCFPNNSFQVEGGSSNTITYSPTLTVSNTTALAAGDALQPIPDSKVINISVGYQKGTAPPLQLRMLITRNGIGQQ
jgi:hypothetical protein